MDKHTESVTNKIKQRAAVGFTKYGKTLERKDLTTIDWLRHAQEEAMDLACYLEVIINNINDSDAHV